MKFFKKFNNHNLYKEYIRNDYELPNISLILSDKYIHYEQKLYDTKVDYLECTGTQYIDTHINVDSSYSIEITMAASNSSGMAIGGRSNMTQPDMHIGYPSEGKIRFKTNKYLKMYNFEENVFYDMKLLNNEFYFDNIKQTPVSISNYQQSPFVLDKTYYLFACNTNGTPTYSNKIKIRKVKIINTNNEILFDAYAVRKNGIGYMYDKVSKQLFGNLGSNNFIIGTDI